MFKILKLASRNLARYWRRTLLTAGLIILGIVAVLLFISVSGSFKDVVIGEVTDSMIRNFPEPTSIRLNGVLPEREAATMPKLAGRVVEGGTANGLVEPGKLLIPALLARGMKGKVGAPAGQVPANPA